MGLYLCVFVDGEELDGVEVGGYDDFQAFREEICGKLENMSYGSRFPTLQLHSDCDGEWSLGELGQLAQELKQIKCELAELPPRELAGWQKVALERRGASAASLLDCFVDVDGLPLVDAILALTDTAIERRVPIVFQ